MLRFGRVPLAFALACVVSLSPAVPHLGFAEGNVANGQSVFNRCSACHQVGSGAQNARGPHLAGLFGRPLASVQGYRYSDGLSARRGELWDPTLLTDYITDPARFIGERSSMPAQRLRPQQVADLIAFLRTQ